jgi:hypothetical protein
MSTTTASSSTPGRSSLRAAAKLAGRFVKKDKSRLPRKEKKALQAKKAA